MRSLTVQGRYGRGARAFDQPAGPVTGVVNIV